MMTKIVVSIHQEVSARPTLDMGIDRVQVFVLLNTVDVVHEGLNLLEHPILLHHYQTHHQQ